MPVGDAAGLRLALQARTATAVGLEYLHALAQSFAEVCAMRFGLVGRLVGEDVHVLAFWTGREFGPPFRYALRGTPCEVVVARGDLCHFDDVQARFPEAGFLHRQGLRCYTGAPLRGHRGDVLGVLVACDQRPRPEIVGLAACVEPFAERAAWLIERIELEDRLRGEATRAAALAEIAALLQHKDMSSRSLDDVCAIVRDTLEVESVSLRLLDASGEALMLAGGAALPASWEQVERVPLALFERSVPPGEVVTMRRPLLASDVLSTEQRSALVARARHEDRVVGVIAAFSRDVGRSWTPEATRWLVGVAGLLSQSLANARLVAALRASEARFREIVTTGVEGIVTLDAEHRITFANPRALTLLGRPDGLVGEALLERLAAAQRTDAGARLERLRGGARQRFEVRLDGHDAQWAVLSATPTFDLAGAYAGATVLLADITETRLLAERVAHLQKLESLGVLAGGIAHDFNNLLGALLGNLDLAQQKLPTGSPARPFLDEVGEAARRAAALTQQMLTYSGRSRPSARRLDLGALLEELSPELADLARGHALRVQAAPGVVVAADASQLRQVLHSLVANANEALVGREGAISVALGTRVVARADLGAHVLGDAALEGPCAALAVSDDGCGIGPEVMPRIFDPFFSTKFTGRGLGLSAVLGIVRGHHGAILVDSAPGEGSTFTLLLPLDAESRARPAPSVARRVLVVDDDPAVLNVGGRVLESAGYEVVRAPDGAVALTQFTAACGEFAAVLLDMSMPVLDGARTFRALRELRPDVPIVLTSGHDVEDVLARLDGAAPDGFVQKPWTADELLRALREATDR